MSKMALITGGSGGIGEALAHEHAKRGGDLVLIARQEEKLAALKVELESKYKIHVHTLALDLTQAGAPKSVYDFVHKQNLEIDYLINNAGFGGGGGFHEQDWDENSRMIMLNVMTLAHLTRLFLPDFVKRGSGRILNVSSSVSALPGGPYQAVYFATKSFVTSFGHGVGTELAGTNVTMTTLCPGAVATSFAKRAGLEDAPIFANASKPEDIAKDGYEAMLKGRLILFSGLTLFQSVLMRLLPFLPKHFMLGYIERRLKGEA